MFRCNIYLSLQRKDFSFQCPVPAKLTVKKFIGDDWMVACLVPKGNMMHCMVRETEAGLKQLKYRLDRQPF